MKPTTLRQFNRLFETITLDNDFIIKLRNTQSNGEWRNTIFNEVRRLKMENTNVEKTERNAEICKLKELGKTNKFIAQYFGISETRVSRILKFNKIEQNRKHFIDEELGLYGEQKQETLEEVAEKYSQELLEAKTIQPYEKTWIKAMQERMFSEEEVYQILLKHQSDYRSHVRKSDKLNWSFNIKVWFEQLKKK